MTVESPGEIGHECSTSRGNSTTRRDLGSRATSESRPGRKVQIAERAICIRFDVNRSHLFPGLTPFFSQGAEPRLDASQ